MKKLSDSYGSIEIEDGVLWGINTQRSLENFPIGIEKMPDIFIESMLQLKKAAAQSNGKRNIIKSEKADLIIKAIDILLEENNPQHFPLSVWQTGSGTQTNMNVNEVIANKAKEINSNIQIHPNDDVNCGQSTNDVFPSSMHICVCLMIERDLLFTMKGLERVLDKLSIEHQDLIKTGRTHLQDATPISFGQEVSAWKHMFVEGRNQLKSVLPFFQTLAIGATAVGTGLNTYEGFDQDVCDHLNRNLNQSFIPSVNKFHAISTKDAFVFGHGALNAIASNAMKMANDIRWLASGPRCGLGELNLPSNEAGSSIMPGKVNPTQAEALTMVCIQVMANGSAVTIAGSQGNFELNAYMPLILQNTWQSIRLLNDGLKSFNERCLKGLSVNQEKMSENLHTSLMSATYLNKKLGYDQATQIVKEAFESNVSIRDIIVLHQVMSEEEFDSFYDYKEMIKAKPL